MTGPCEGKVALIAGGTRGLGRACALALADAGAIVVPAGRQLENSQAVVDELEDAGARAKALAWDVADFDAGPRAVGEVLEAFGKLDIFVANAGINPFWSRAEKVTPAMWDELMDVNLKGNFFAIQAAARPMLEQGSGSIVGVSSVTATVGVPRGIPYIASKGGMDAMTRALAIEWVDRGVRVNGVAPGYIETDMTRGMRENDSLRQTLIEGIPMNRFAAPAEIAALIAFLASDAASYITGQTFLADGGIAAGHHMPQKSSGNTKR